MTTELSSLVDETKRLLGEVRGSLIRVAMNLSQLKSQGNFGDKGSWSAFCEGELGISEGFASKLLTVQRVYIQEGGLAPEDLEGIDHEKLYLARNVEGPAELKLETARTLTRKEVKQSAKPHEAVYKELCVECYLTRESHP